MTDRDSRERGRQHSVAPTPHGRLTRLASSAHMHGGLSRHHTRHLLFPSGTVPKNDVDFATAVEKGTKVKENIRRLYNSVFTEEKLEKEAEYSRALMHLSMTPASNARRTAVMTDSSIGSIYAMPKLEYDDDTALEKRDGVGIFPVADEKVFPPRRPRTGWETGLRHYAQPSPQSLPHTETAQTKLPVESIAEKSRQEPRPKSAPRSHRTPRRGTPSKEKTVYAVEDSLPPLSAETESKYFGDSAVEKYRETYTALKRQGEILRGGYEELHEIVTSGHEENIFSHSLHVMNDAGVLTPRGAKPKPLRREMTKQRTLKAMREQFRIPSLRLSISSSINRSASEDSDIFASSDDIPILALVAMRGLKPTASRSSVQFDLSDEKSRSRDSTGRDSKRDLHKKREGLTPHAVMSTPLNRVNSVVLDIEEEKLRQRERERDYEYSVQTEIERIDERLRKKLKKMRRLLDDPLEYDDDQGRGTLTETEVEYDSDDSQPRPPRPIARSIDADNELRVSRLDTHLCEDTATGPPLHSPLSPRAIFISGCLQRSLPPRVRVLLRKRVSNTINLAHMGIGNETAKVLAEALPFIPHLQVINLCDNALEDDGLSALIHSIAKHPTIEVLDISQNVIDDLAADALASFIGNDQCTLKCLRMSSANLDDGECARFVDVLMHNRHLRELDMSKNLLGKDENLNAMQPDFTTGGEALSELIKAGTCPIEILNLHWNMIRLEGAQVLCDSIRSNFHLLHLDLSYNALGGSAACILGDALMENKTLRELNIANNGIDAVGCFTLFVGLRENQVLNKINISGNPIGDQGARIMMKIAANQGDRLEIIANNCDFKARSAAVKFRIDEACGNYQLDLAEPYDRAIFLELLNIAANDCSIEIRSVEFMRAGTSSGFKTPDASRPNSAKNKTSSAGGEDTLFKILRFEEKRESIGDHELLELSHLQTFVAVADMPVAELTMLCDSQEPRGKEFFVVAALPNVLTALRVEPMEQIVEEVKLTLDPRESGHIDTHEFVEYILDRARKACKRVHEMQHAPHCALISATTLALAHRPTLMSSLSRYIPPNEGRVKVSVMEGYHISDELQLSPYPLSKSQSSLILHTAEQSSDAVELVLLAIETQRLYLEEAQSLYKFIAHFSDEPTLELGKILLRMDSAQDAMRMVRSFVGGDIVKLRRLRTKLGHAYFPLVGVFSGFYSLDLSQSLDRLCLKRLIERSVRSIEERRKANRGDTSQHGNWSSFRNEYHHKYNKAFLGPGNATINAGNDVSEGDRTISPKHFYPIPQIGKAEFDFVDIARPNPDLCRAAHEDRIIDILLLSRLLNEDRTEWAQHRLNEMSMSVRRSLLADGSSPLAAGLGKAHLIGFHLFEMYSKLSQRTQAISKAIKREQIKTAPITSEKATGRKKPASDMSSKRNTEITTGRRRTASKDAAEGDSSRSVTASSLSRSIKKEREREKSMESSTTQHSGKRTLGGLVQQNKLQRVNSVMDKFLSLIERGRANQALSQWGQRLYEVVVESTGSDEHKSSALLEFFDAELTPLWLYCKHIALILELFEDFGCANRSNLGSYRVELIVMLFARIVDLHNFDLITATLSAEEHAALLARIGVLNIFNPNKPEGGYSFDLTRWEERQVAKMLIHLSVVEPGDNWLNKSFIFDRGFNPIPGWDLTVNWLNEEGLPRKGLLALEMFAGDGKRLLGCCVDLKLRQILTGLVLVDARDHAAEIRRRDMLGVEGDRFMIEHASSVSESNSNSPTKSVGGGMHHRFHHVNALLKLHTQLDVLRTLKDEERDKDGDGDREILQYTVEDAQQHLAEETDITWTYAWTASKAESWVSTTVGAASLPV